MSAKQAWIVVGLGYGDEGKGTISDALVQRTGAELVVRFNGGAQAAHTVVHGEVSHTFHQFGAGTLSGALTHLSRFHLFNPIALVEEASALQDLGIYDPYERLSISPEALITTPYHVAMNRLRERARGEARHGSCGMGIGETVEDSLAGRALRVGDLLKPNVAREKLTEIREAKWRQAESISGDFSDPNSRVFSSEEEFEATLEVYELVISRLGGVAPDREVLGKALNRGSAVCEGAQGILLDEKYGTEPHTTWSNCTTENARRLLEEAGCRDLTSIGVTRAYSTRHGAGPLRYETPELTAKLVDPHNPKNLWQGSFRSGHFDLEASRYALQHSGGIDLLAVTCVDQWSKEMGIGEGGAVAYANSCEAHLQRIADGLNHPIGILGEGADTARKRFWRRA